MGDIQDDGAAKIGGHAKKYVPPHLRGSGGGEEVQSDVKPFGGGKGGFSQKGEREHKGDRDYDRDGGYQRGGDQRESKKGFSKERRDYDRKGQKGYGRKDKDDERKEKPRQLDDDRVRDKEWETEECAQPGQEEKWVDNRAGYEEDAPQPKRFGGYSNPKPQTVVPKKEVPAVNYGKQDIRSRIPNKPAPGGNVDNGSGVQSWHTRNDARKNYPHVDEPEEDIFPPRKDRNTGVIDFEAYDRITVERSGDNCDVYAKIERFSEARLHDDLYENVNRCGYDRPTPIQKHSIPIIRGGRDLMACAQTGSGKTAAFLIPAIQSLLDKGPPNTNDAQVGGYQKQNLQRVGLPAVLVLAPTRELVSQIFDEGRKFSYKTGIRCAVVYGGAPLPEQKREVMKGIDILVAAPGRLTHMYEENWINLGFCRYLVLDEADRMLDMGFEPQVRQIVEHTNMGEYYWDYKKDRMSIPRQTMMFSATFQDEIQILARDFLNEYVFLTVGRVGSTSDLIEQKVVYAQEHDKVARLKRCLKDADIGVNPDCLALVFVETKKGADVLERELWRSNFAVTAIHGNRNQQEREEALAAFRSGQNPILVATDVAARGLDIPNVALVINYDLPKNIDDYVHRIGRTGRAGRKGKAIAFINDLQCSKDILKRLNDVLLDGKQERPAWFEELCKTNGRAVAGGAAPVKVARDMRARDEGFGKPGGFASRDAGAPKKAPTRGPPAIMTNNKMGMSHFGPQTGGGSFGNSGSADAW